VLGALVAMIGGVLLGLTEHVDWNDRLLFGAAALCIQLRLLANVLDGMVAIEGNARSALGELFNDVPDRIADSALLIGAGYAAGSSPELGWAAAVLALFVTYVRVLGRSCGAPSDFGGPMAKPHRMALLTAACVWLAVAPTGWRPQLPEMPGAPTPGLMWAALALIGAGCVLTSLLRLRRIAAHMRRNAPEASP